MENITVNDIVTAVGGVLLCGDGNTKTDHISIDSRTMSGNDIFVPLIGEKTDAHLFIAQAVRNGAIAVLTSRHHTHKDIEEAGLDDTIAYISVRDTKDALQDIGRFYRSRIGIPLIGITGSVGKTTTREMVAAALSANYKVYKTPANRNSQVGVPITISEIMSDDQIGVLELGMSEPGEMTVIARIARVDMAVITNVGVTHIEQLGSRENILKEKMSIQDGLKAGGILFLNGDNDLLSRVTAREDVKTIYYGTGENSDYQAVDIRIEDGKPSFTLIHNQDKVFVKLQVMGEHNVLNAAVSLAVCSECGVSMEAAARELETFDGFKNRQQVYEIDGVTVIDDTYNASPESMKAGLKVLASMKQCSRRIAVLADMKELGSRAGMYHYEVGAFLGDLGIDYVLTLGELASMIGKGVKDSNPETEVSIFKESERDRLIQSLKDRIRPGDGILFKGSNSMKLGEVASHFIGHIKE